MAVNGCLSQCIFTLAQAQKELAALKEAVAARQTGTAAVGNMEMARAICFTLALAARGVDRKGKPLSPVRLSRAKAMHFTLFGTPDIDPAKFGAAAPTAISCIDIASNALVSEADAVRWGY